MRHVPDGVLRRLDDEPLAIPDRVADHVAGCERCSDRRAGIAYDTERAAALFADPQPAPDTGMAWARLERELRRSAPPAANRRPRGGSRSHRPRVPQVSLRAGLVVGALGIVVAGTAAAATLTNIFAPTHVAPVAVSQRDIRAVADFMGLGNTQALGGFNSPTGASRFRFGTIRWSSRPPRPASTVAGASAAAGFPVPLPHRLPAGVGAIQQLVVQPRVAATVTFNASAGSLAGKSVTLDAGPAVVAGYGGTGGNNVPTLAVATMPRPTAFSAGTSVSQIEAFLLRQPGIPPELAEEIRLLGNLGTTLPVPVPAGADVHSVQVDGWPGVLLADASNAAAGVVWEDGRGMLHVVAGILDSHDVLNVADQLG